MRDWAVPASAMGLLLPEDGGPPIFAHPAKPDKTAHTVAPSPGRDHQEILAALAGPPPPTEPTEERPCPNPSTSTSSRWPGATTPSGARSPPASIARWWPHPSPPGGSRAG